MKTLPASLQEALHPVMASSHPHAGILQGLVAELLLGTTFLWHGRPEFLHHLGVNLVVTRQAIHNGRPRDLNAVAIVE